MSGIYILTEIPKSCISCEWRDAEAGGCCELIGFNDYKTYEEQHNHCPFGKVARRHGIAFYASRIYPDCESTSTEWFNSGHIGKTIFLTREEAEAAVKGEAGMNGVE